jgi:uncharacterized membrane protein
MKNKIITILLAVITVVASLSIVFFAAKYDSTTKYDTYLSLSMYAVYAVMAIAFICLLGFAVWSIAANFKDSKESLIGVGVVAVVMLISYLISSPSSSAIEVKFAVSTQLSKVIGGGAIAAYIFGMGAIAAAVWSSISNKLK